MAVYLLMKDDCLSQTKTHTKAAAGTFVLFLLYTHRSFEVSNVSLIFCVCGCVCCAESFGAASLGEKNSHIIKSNLDVVNTLFLRGSLASFHFS